MMTPTDRLTALQALPQALELSQALRAACAEAYAHRDGERLTALLARSPHLTLPSGGLADVLSAAASSPEARAELGAATALALATAPVDAELAAQLAWLVTHAWLRPLPYLDAAFGSQAGPLFEQLGLLALEPQRFGLGAGEALVAAAALKLSSSAAARQALERLRASPEPLLAGVAGAAAVSERLHGELRRAPRGPIATLVLAATGYLFVEGLVRVVGRVALGYARPAELALGPAGLQLTGSTRLLGRTLREHRSLIALSELQRVTRELRFSRLGLYAGLFALALGSYLGVSLVVDGVRVPGSSASLIAMGLLFIALGVALDYGLTRLTDAVQARAWLVVRGRRRGQSFSLSGVDPSAADALLQAVLAQLR